MHKLNLSCTTFAIVCLWSNWCEAQTEPIGPLTLIPNQPHVEVFTNFIPPDPLFKELQFIGTANVPGGVISDLLVEFDYIDAAGNNVVVPAPTSMFTVIGGAPNMIDTGILTLPFCPRVVSLHLTNQDPTGAIAMDLQGTYRHECFQVPEPNGTVGFTLSALALTAFRRRRFIQNSPC